MTEFIVTTSWDDGHPLDLKLADILERYKIKGTFYIAPSNREQTTMTTGELRELATCFEIGAHTLTHPRLTQLDRNILDHEIRGSKQYLEDVLGLPVTAFSYPKGKFNREVKQVVRNIGFKCARTTECYCLKRTKDLFMMPTTVLARPLPLHIKLGHVVRRKNWPGLSDLVQIGVHKSWAQMACGFFEKFLHRGGLWHLWGHSWEIDQHHLWDDLKQVLKFVSQHSKVKYLTNGELVQELSQ